MGDEDYKNGETEGLAIGYLADDGRVFRGQWTKGFMKEGETSYLEGDNMRVLYRESFQDIGTADHWSNQRPATKTRI